MEKTFLQPPFVGESRLLLVDGLVTLFDQVNERNESCWVSIEAPSGWGKTRVAQEFYARLAARQEQHYWPATILEASDVDSLDVSARRKRVFPNPQYFKRPPGSLPNFMWWGIACDMRNGVASQTLLEDLQQLDAHKIYLEATWAAHASFKEKRFPTLAAAKQALSDVVEEAASAGLGEVIEQVSGATVPGLGLIVKLGRWGIGKTKTSCETKEKLLAGGKLDDGSNRDDLLEDIVATVAKMARPGLPTVVFVEDFHKATPLMEELVERLVRTNAALLIITTSWPGELDFGGTPQKLFADDFLKSRILRIQTGTELPDLFHSGASMDELPKQALREIILSYYPHTDEETLEHLASRYNNPLPLELVCTMPVYQDNFAANGKLKLSAQEIDALPVEVEDLYRELWKALPKEAQQALALATLAIPGKDSAWHSHLIQGAIQQCDGIGNHEAIARMLETDRIPHGWARFIETWLRRFNEPDQLHIAQTYVSKFFLEENIDHYLDRLAEKLREMKYDGNGADEQHCARLTLVLHNKGKMDDLYALKAIRLLQAVLSELPRELPERIKLGEYLVELEVEENSVEMLDGRSDYARALGESGKVEAALEQFNTLLTEQLRILGTDHPDTFRTRSNIASEFCHSGQVETALEQFNTLLTDQIRILGEKHPDTMNTLQVIDFLADRLAGSNNQNDGANGSTQ